MDSRPNIVLIHTHDTGRHLGCYGAPVPTHNVCRLAREGVMFRQAYCASPGCAASRSAMLTGVTAHNSGMLGLCHRGFRLRDPKAHLSHLLRDAGYRTKLIGFQHEVPDSEIGILGYDEALVAGDCPPASRDRAELGERWLAAAPPQPFFLNVGLLDTHRPYGPVEPPEDARYTNPLPWLPDHPDVRQDVAALNSSVRRADEAVGILLSAVDRLGLAENTLFIYTTDHGVAFPRAKATLFDPGIGVALVMRGPGGFDGGQVFDALVSHLDLLPTLCALTGMKVPREAQGVSLLPLVRGRADEVRDAVFAEITYHAAYDPARAVRTARHKYIRYYESYPRMVLPNVDNGFTKYLLTDSGLPALARPKEILCDLLADPLEFENVADRPEYAGVKAEMTGRLDTWMSATDDPLLFGPVPLPEGGTTTPPTDYNPEGGPRSV